MTKSVKSTAGSILEPVSRPEHPEDHAEAQRQEEGDRAHTDLDPDIALAEEGPAEPAAQLDDGIEQRPRAPCRRQHVARIEGAAEEGQRIDDEQRDDPPPHEALRPAERRGGEACVDTCRHRWSPDHEKTKNK